MMIVSLGMGSATNVRELVHNFGVCGPFLLNEAVEMLPAPQSSVAMTPYVVPDSLIV